MALQLTDTKAGWTINIPSSGVTRKHIADLVARNEVVELDITAPRLMATALGALIGLFARFDTSRAVARAQVSIGIMTAQLVDLSFIEKARTDDTYLDTLSEGLWSRFENSVLRTDQE
jgi:hypothetical protein